MRTLGKRKGALLSAGGDGLGKLGVLGGTDLKTILGLDISRGPGEYINGLK